MKTLIYKLAIFAAVISYSSGWSQITFLEDFETSPGWDDPDGWYYLDMPFESCNDMVYITFLYSDYAGYEEIAISPSIGVSNGGVATLTYDYKLVQYSNPYITLENTPSWGSIKVEYSTSDAGPWILIDVITPENHVVSTSCATRTAQFTPEPGNDIYLRLNVQVDDQSAGIDALVYLDNIAVFQAELCETEAPELPAAQTVCSNANIGDLDTGDYATIIWYTGVSGGTPLASGVALVDGGIYYAANFEECESSERTPVTVTINVVEEPEAEPAQSFCTSAIVNDLQVEDDDANISWYAASTGGAPLAGTAPLTGGNTYYASQTVDGCESTDRTAVMVTITSVESPEAVATQSFCTAATVEDLQVEDNEAAVSWYAGPTGGAPLSGAAALVNGTTYHVSQTINGCESDRTPVAVTITIAEEPVTAAIQSFCTSATVEDLQVEDSEGIVSWYASEDGDDALPSSTILTSGSTYYVSQTIDGCESARVAVAVTIIIVDAPDVENPQVFEENVVLYDIEVEANGIIKWYATEEDALAGENALPETTTITESGTYYVTQTSTGCESEPTMVAIDILLGIDSFEVLSIAVYPNPVSDILTILSDRQIGTVIIYNLLGQQMLSKTVLQNDGRVDVTALSPGTYLLEVRAGDEVSKSKIIKK